MTALDALRKLGEFPAVEEYELHRQLEDYGPQMPLLRARADAALEEVAEYSLGRVEKSWTGLHCILDEIYPSDIFTGESGDPGPKMVVLTRALGEAEARAEKAEDKLVKSIEWGRIEQQRKQEAEERAEQAEFFARGWHKQFSRVNKARHAERDAGDAYKALCDRLEEELEQAKKEADYYRDHYELVFEQRNAAEAKLAARELDREGYMRRIQAAKAEAHKWEWCLDYILSRSRAADVYQDIPEARLGDVEDAKRCLAERYEDAHQHTRC